MKRSFLLAAMALVTATAFAQTTQPTQPSSTQAPSSTQTPSSIPSQPPSTTTPPTSSSDSPGTMQSPSSTDPATPSSADEETDVAMQSASEWPMFEKVDANADGYINRTEGGENAQLMAMWSELDQDQNGSLSSGEYARGRERNDTKDTNR